MDCKVKKSNVALGDTERLIRQLLEERILILDGAMGTMIQRYRLSEDDYTASPFDRLQRTLEHPQRGNNDLLSITQPHIIEEIHRAYLSAGADIISTNTFSLTSIGMHDYGLEREVRRLNLAAAQIARRVADEFTALEPSKPRFVAGAIGPTNKTASMSPDVEDPMYRAVTFEDLRRAYDEQIQALVEGGVDLLLMETIFDTLNVKAALFAAEDVSERLGKHTPIMLSVTITDRSGRTLSGQTLGAFVASVAHAHVLSIGINCSFGASDMKPYIEELGKLSPLYISAYPNAGLPNVLGEYDETPERMAEQIKEYIAEGLVNIVGGCCGTTPEHIARYCDLVAGASIRIRPERPEVMTLSGLERLEVTKDLNFLNVGERCNVAGSRKFLRLIQQEKYEEALEIARRQVDDGAQVLDINMDDGLLDGVREMTRFVNLLASDPEIARVPLMIDSSKWEVIEAGLRCTQGKAIVNSISLKNGQEEFLRHARLVRRYGAAVIVMAFDEHGQADTCSRRVEICQRAYDLLVEDGFPREDIIFDPNVLAIATGIDEHRRYALDFIETVGWIKGNLPGAKVSGGVSNLSFSFRGHDYIREAMHAVFLYHAIRAGMDMGIINPGQSVLYEEIPRDLLVLIEDVIFDRNDDATERLIDYAKDSHAEAVGAHESKTEQWRTLSIEDRLSHALVKGIPDYMDEDLAEALKVYPRALDIIDKPLMAGMNKVGDLFGEGKMFLPQVVKAARTMKKAVAILQPIIEAEQAAGGARSAAGKILLATVKGDVHDIGKNIVGVVLACNNYEVIDLGVMVPPERILEAIEIEKPDLVGLSGLITPSLEEMAIVAEHMSKAGLDIPLLIGGATTSKLHTALKIEPMYRGGGVIYTKDASQLPPVVANILNPDTRIPFLQSIQDEYAEMRSRHTEAPRQLLTLEQARAKALQIDWHAMPPIKPREQGRFVLRDIALEDVVPYLNWKFFYYAWGLAPKYASIATIDDCAGCRSAWMAGFPADEQERAREAAQLYDDARNLLREIVERRLSRLQAVFSILPAYADGDNIYIDGVPYPMMRAQQVNGKGVCPCLSDFVAPSQAEVDDYIGAFAVTAGHESEYLEALYGSAHQADEYTTFLIKSLLDRLAEATTEWLHRQVRRHYWGYVPDEELSVEEVLAERYKGIRPAVGYPSIPDQSMNFPLHDLLHATEIGISLTENGVMYPNASVSGLIFAHPEAKYFSIGHISQEQARDYAERRGVSEASLRKFLMANM